MKKLLIILLVFPFFSFLSPDYKAADFVGRWQGEDNGDVVFMVFDAEGYVSMKMGEEVVGGKEYTVAGRKISMKYKIDDTTHPIHVDFVVTDLETKEQDIMLGIATFDDIDNMHLAFDVEGSKRPVVFDEENSIVLSRVK